MFGLDEPKDSTIIFQEQLSTRNVRIPLPNILDYSNIQHETYHEILNDITYLSQIRQKEMWKGSLPISELLSKLVNRGIISRALIRKSNEVGNKLKEILTNYSHDMYISAINLDGEWVPSIEVFVDVKDTSELITIWRDTLKHLESIVGKEILKEIHIEFNEKE